MELNSIFQTNLNFEIINPIESELLQDYIKVNDCIKNLATQNERIARLEEISKRDSENYCSVVRGLIYGILQDVNKNKESLFNYINHINQDGYEFLLISICRLIDSCHTLITNNIYINLFWLFEKLSHLSSPNLIEFLKLLLRNIWPEIWNQQKLEYYSNLLLLIKNKISFIASSKQSLSSLVFIKILRLKYIDHHFRSDYMLSIIEDEVFILSKLWSMKKDEILLIGKELIRMIISISKVQRPEIITIIEEIGKSDYWSLLSMPSPKLGFNPYIQICIPPLIERMMCFLLSEAKRINLNRHMIWMMKKLNISAEGQDESILPDLVRYIITCMQSQNNFPELPQRWILIGWYIKILQRILKYCKTTIISSEIKQAIFFDWLFYKKEKDSIMLIEPGILVMFCSMREYPEITMELIEFLDLFSENFDLSKKFDIRSCVKNAFISSENTQIIGSLKTILLDDKISNEIKKIYEELIQIQGINLSQNNIINDNLLMKNNQQKDMDTIFSQADSFEEVLQVKKEDKITKEVIMKKLEYDVYIHPDLQKMIGEPTINNLLNYRIKQHFSKFLKEFISKSIINFNQNILQDSKLINLQLDIYVHFAHFFLTFFKDELISKIDVEDENFQNKYVSNELFYCLFLSNNEKNEKEFKIMIEIMRKILEKFPNFLGRLIYFIIKKIMSYKSKINSIDKQKCTARILYKLWSLENLKEKLNGLFINSVENLDLDLINFFILNVFHYYNDLFHDDNEMMLKLIQYADATSINKICNDLACNKYILLSKNLFKMLELSLECEIIDIKNLWNIIVSQKLNLLTNRKEFLNNFSIIIKLIEEKCKSDQMSLISYLNEFSRNLYLVLKLNFMNEVNESNINEFVILFQLPIFFCESTYAFLQILSQSFKNFPQIFSIMIDDFINYNNQIKENFQERNYNILNLIINTRKFISLEMNNHIRILFDSNLFSIKNLRIKLESMSKGYGIKIVEDDF